MKILLGAIAGGCVGILLFFLGKCVSGTCPIVNNPAAAVITFSIAGMGVASLIFGKKQ
jgi:hypothetical protein